MRQLLREAWKLVRCVAGLSVLFVSWRMLDTARVFDRAAFELNLVARRVAGITAADEV